MEMEMGVVAGIDGGQSYITTVVAVRWQSDGRWKGRSRFDDEEFSYKVLGTANYCVCDVGEHVGTDLSVHISQKLRLFR